GQRHRPGGAARRAGLLAAARGRPGPGHPREPAFGIDNSVFPDQYRRRHYRRRVHGTGAVARAPDRGRIGRRTALRGPRRRRRLVRAGVAAGSLGGGAVLAPAAPVTATAYSPEPALSVLALRCVRDVALAAVRRDSTLRACPSIV